MNSQDKEENEIAMKGEIVALKKNIDVLQTEIQHHKNENQKLKNEKQKLTEELLSTKKLINGNSIEVEIRDRSIQNLEEEKKILQQEITVLKEKVRKMTAHLEEYECEIEEKKKAVGMKELALQRYVNDDRKEMERLSTESGKIKASLKECCLIKESLKKFIGEKDERILILKKLQGVAGGKSLSFLAADLDLPQTRIRTVVENLVQNECVQLIQDMVLFKKYPWE